MYSTQYLTVWLGALVLLFCSSANASLIGTELSVQTIVQRTESSTPLVIGFETTATVTEPGVEFPDLSLTDTDVPGYTIVPVGLNAGDTFLELDVLDSAGSGSSGSSFFNGYQFTFDSDALVDITGVMINNELTTLGIDDSDVSFSGNNLFLNVEGLPFNPSSFARLDLVVEGGPGDGSTPANGDGMDGQPPVSVPEPTPFGLAIFALVLVCALRRRCPPSKWLTPRHARLNDA